MVSGHSQRAALQSRQLQQQAHRQVDWKDITENLPDARQVLPSIGGPPQQQHFQINEILSNTTKKKSSKANQFVLMSTPEEDETLGADELKIKRKLAPPNTAAGNQQPRW